MDAPHRHRLHRLHRSQRDAVRARLLRHLGELLGASPSSAAQIHAAEHAGAALDREAQRALDRTPWATPACSAGCSYCCHVHVDATRPELLAIVAHLRRTRSAAELDALRSALAENAARVGHLDDAERWAAKLPCALLGADGDGRCTIYEARPLRCRAFHACSVDRCRAAFVSGAGEVDDIDDIGDAGDVSLEMNPAIVRATDAVEAAYDEALVRAGISAAPERLEAGLLALLSVVSLVAGVSEASSP